MRATREATLGAEHEHTLQVTAALHSLQSWQSAQKSAVTVLAAGSTPASPGEEADGVLAGVCHFLFCRGASPTAVSRIQDL